jgi:hypothetical protein
VRSVLAASIAALAAACSGSSTAPAEATASPSAEVVLSAAPSAKPSRVHVSALVTKVKKFASDGSVEDGELGEPEAYVAAVEADHAALDKCAIKDEVGISLKLLPSGEIATLDELDAAEPCVTNAVRAAKFPKAPTEVVVLIVVSRAR